MTPADLPSSDSESARSENASSSEAPPPSRSRALVISIWIVALLVALRVALPFAVEWSIPRLAAQQSLQVQVGNVDLGLIVGEISVENLVVEFPPEGAPESPLTQPPESEGPEPFFALGRLYIAFEWTDLLFGRLHITDLQLDGPAIRLTQLADGGLKLPRAWFEEAADAASEAQTPAVAEGGADPNPESFDAQSGEAGLEFTLDRFELNEPVLSLRSETTNIEVVHLAAEQLQLDALSVGPNGIRLSGIDLEHPELFVQREWLLGLDAGPSERDDAPAEMPAVQMGHLNIQRAALTVRTRRGPLKAALRLKLTDAGTALGYTFPVDAALQIVDANIAIDGQLGLNPVSFEGRLNWQNLAAPPLLLLSYPEVVPWLASCDAHGELEITFRSAASSSGPAGLTARGNTSVTELSFKHPETGELALEWESLEVEIREAFLPLESTPEVRGRFELSRLALTSPRIVYTNPPDALDELLAALEAGSTAAEEPASDDEAGGAAMISIAAVALEGGTLLYVDRAVQPTHETKIHALRARVDDFATNPLGAEKVSVDGLIQSVGSFKLRGGVPRGLGKLELALRRLDLVSYDSLASEVGWHIERGSSSLDSVLEAHGDGYRTRNELVLHDLDVTPEDGAGFSSRFGMSVDLALALLRDPAGDISLSMPIEFDADGTGVNLGPLLLSALRNALKGALASPIKMFGMLRPASGGAASFGILPFAPGEREPGPETRDRLKPLAKLLANRPMLGLALRGHWNPQDRRTLAMAILSEHALSGGALPDIENASLSAHRRVLGALRARAAEDEGALDAKDTALLERYAKAQEVPIERYRAFAKARAEAARDALIELGAPGEALQLRAAEPADQPGVGADLYPRAAQDG